MSLPTVYRALKSIKISRKNLRREASERSQICRDSYMLEVSRYIYEMLVYLDKSAANERTAQRKRGWAAFGIRPVILYPVKRSERFSVLPAYISDGILASHIYQGAINGARFEWFLANEVLPRCTPFPGPRSVLIMDNCSTYYSAGVKALCDHHGVILLCLPPYSPDYNPIEEFFSVLKAWLKRHFELAEGISFKTFLETAVASYSGGQYTKGYFEHAGVYVGEYKDELQERFEDDYETDFEE